LRLCRFTAKADGYSGLINPSYDSQFMQLSGGQMLLTVERKLGALLEEDDSKGEV
jgi:hypothetical protein